MFIEAVKMKSVGTKVSGMDVVVTTAGKRDKVDGMWEQKLGLTDTTGHIWAILVRKENIPIIKSNELLVKTAIVEEFETKGGAMDKRLRITGFDRKTQVGEPDTGKTKFEGVIEPLVEKILEKYDIAPTDALWPCTRKNKKTNTVKTNWIIYHRYCEQIAAKAGIVFDSPEVVVNDREAREVVLLITGTLGHVKEWSYGEASPATTILPYIFAMAEKRGKDRVILKLAGFHGMVYSDVEEDWSNNK